MTPEAWDILAEALRPTRGGPRVPGRLFHDVYERSMVVPQVIPKNGLAQQTHLNGNYRKMVNFEATLLVFRSWPPGRHGALAGGRGSMRPS